MEAGTFHVKSSIQIIFKTKPPISNFFLPPTMSRYIYILVKSEILALHEVRNTVFHKFQKSVFSGTQRPWISISECPYLTKIDVIQAVLVWLSYKFSPSMFLNWGIQISHLESCITDRKSTLLVTKICRENIQNVSVRHLWDRNEHLKPPKFDWNLSTYLSSHNFSPLSSVQILLIPACCLLCVL